MRLKKEDAKKSIVTPAAALPDPKFETIEKAKPYEFTDNPQNDLSACDQLSGFEHKKCRRAVFKHHSGVDK